MCYVWVSHLRSAENEDYVDKVFVSAYVITETNTAAANKNWDLWPREQALFCMQWNSPVLEGVEVPYQTIN